MKINKVYKFVVIAILLLTFLTYRTELFSKEAFLYKFPHAIKEQSLIISDDGFYPQHVVLFEAEELKLYITSVAKHASCFLLPSHKIFLGIEKGEIVEVNHLFLKSGEYPFYCPTGKIEGKITVLSRKGFVVKQKLKSLKRSIALKEDQDNYWSPRDY